MSGVAAEWLRDVVDMKSLGLKESAVSGIRIVERPRAQLCLMCRGGKLLCGKRRCPLILRAQSLVKHSPLIDTDQVSGASPPGVFVGRMGYPKVYIGPLVPPYHGDTEILDTPEWWLGKSIEEIVDFRFSLIRGSARANVVDAREGGRLIERLQELALAVRPIDAELLLKKKPVGTLVLSESSQPFGPSAPMRDLKMSHVSVDRRIERAYYDTDLKAAEAVSRLYEEGVLVTCIQRAFSIGCFGTRPLRRLVPTRWSITAVDSIISSRLIDQVKQHSTIDEYRVYHLRNLDNIYVVLLMPERWRFEWIEAWFPNTAWNRYGLKPSLMGDYEEYWGRTAYPSIGGCYYSARLAVVERLVQERRQASALLLREIHPGYLLPVGVWNVRESLRATLKTKPRRFDDLQAAVRYSMSKLTIPLKHWMEASALLKRALFQRKISQYL